jgi:hypothetical protein
MRHFALMWFALTANIISTEMARAQQIYIKSYIVYGGRAGPSYYFFLKTYSGSFSQVTDKSAKYEISSTIRYLDPGSKYIYRDVSYSTDCSRGKVSRYAVQYYYGLSQPAQNREFPKGPEPYVAPAIGSPEYRMMSAVCKRDTSPTMDFITWDQAANYAANLDTSPRSVSLAQPRVVSQRGTGTSTSLLRAEPQSTDRLALARRYIRLRPFQESYSSSGYEGPDRHSVYRDLGTDQKTEISMPYSLPNGFHVVRFSFRLGTERNNVCVDEDFQRGPGRTESGAFKTIEDGTYGYYHHDYTVNGAYDCIYAASIFSFEP